jgi:hypothetical protein
MNIDYLNLIGKILINKLIKEKHTLINGLIDVFSDFIFMRRGNTFLLFLLYLGKVEFYNVKANPNKVSQKLNFILLKIIIYIYIFYIKNNFKKYIYYFNIFLNKNNCYRYSKHAMTAVLP